MDLRYLKNLNSFTEGDQFKINTTTVLIIGLGGLGGFVVDFLSRLGVQKIKLLDFDTFDTSNLNRQLLSTQKNIGSFKAIEAKKYINSVNSCIEVEVFCNKFEECDFNFLFKNVNVVFDCCDNIKTKLNIENQCQFFKIPLIYGAVAGYFGQVACILPEYPILKKIYPKEHSSGIENKLGNLCFIVSIIASLQISLFINLILNISNNNLYGFYYIDIENYEIQWISFKI